MAGGGNAIGTGSLVLIANADKLVAGLNRAEALTKKSAEKMKATASGISLGGAVLAGGAGGALAGVALDLLKRGLSTAFDKIRDIAGQREQTELLARSFDTMARSMDRVAKNADMALNAIADPKQRLVALDNELGRTESKLAEWTAAMKGARAILRDLRDDTSERAMIARFFGRLDEDTKKAEVTLKAAETAVDKLTERFLDLGEARSRALNPSTDPALIGEVNKLTEALKVQAATFGMTSGQAKLYELRLRGATNEQLREAERLTEELDRFRVRTRADHSIDSRAHSGRTPPALTASLRSSKPGTCSRPTKRRNRRGNSSASTLH